MLAVHFLVCSLIGHDLGLNIYSKSLLQFTSSARIISEHEAKDQNSEQK